MSETSGPAGTGRQVDELEARSAALRQAARSKGAEPGELLDAALTELDGAVDLLRVAQAAAGDSAQAAGTAERSLLRAVFSDAPVPLFLLARDGTVQRANGSAADLIGSAPGYATGRPFTALVNLASRAAVQSQLSAVARTGKQRLIRCSLLSAAGPVPGELIIGRVGVRGEADQLVVAVRDPAEPPRRFPVGWAGDRARVPAERRRRRPRPRRLPDDRPPASRAVPATAVAAPPTARVPILLLRGLLLRRAGHRPSARSGYGRGQAAAGE